MLYLSAIILSFFLSFVLITKKNKTHADFILVGWLVATGFHLFTFYLFFNGQYLDYPTLIALGFPLPLVQGPFLYLYTSQQTSSLPFNKKQLLHFIPAILSYLLFMQFYLMPFEQKVEIFKLKGQGYETQIMVNSYAIYISGVLYAALSLSRLLKYRKNMVNQFSNTEKINFNWLLYLIIWMVAIWSVILFIQEDKLIFGSAALFVIWLGYFGIKQVQVFSQSTAVVQPSQPLYNDEEENKPGNEIKNEFDTPVLDDSAVGSKYQKSSLSEEDASLIHERLKHLMAEQKPFTNPDLTLNELAKSLEVHPNNLSQVINSRERKSFYDLVNERRVEEFRNLVSKSLNQQFTLLGIAYDCGFNSKASFNRNFKKYIGLTPSDYLKQLQPN